MQKTPPCTQHEGFRLPLSDRRHPIFAMQRYVSLMNKEGVFDRHHQNLWHAKFIQSSGLALCDSAIKPSPDARCPSCCFSGRPQLGIVGARCQTNSVLNGRASIRRQDAPRLYQHAACSPRVLAGASQATVPAPVIVQIVEVTGTSIDQAPPCIYISH